MRAAIDFLKAHDCDHLYLLGDIFDGWKLEDRSYWHCPQLYADLIDEIIRKQKSGTIVRYTPGNHDEKMSNLIPTALRSLFKTKLGIEIAEQFVHETAGEKRLLCLHGHQFDSNVIERISRPADRTYETITEKWNAMHQWCVDRRLLPPKRKLKIDGQKTSRFSLGRAIARGGSTLLKAFTNAAIRRVLHDGYDGIVYGHSHVFQLIQRSEKIIANCGSFTLKEDNAPDGKHTGLIETMDGQLQPIAWPMMRNKAQDKQLPSFHPHDISCEFPETRVILWAAYLLWKPVKISKKSNDAKDFAQMRYALRQIA